MHESTMHLTVEITTPVHRTICTDACGIGKVTPPGMVFGGDWWIEKCRVVQYLKTGSFQPFFEMRRHAHAPARRVRMSSPAATGLLSCYLRVSFRFIQTWVFLTRF
jgi:hypothetical protein